MASKAIELPASFGKYFLTDKLGAGGMAEIFLAKLTGPNGFEKRLVIKKIHPEMSGESTFVELFVAEAKTLVGLSHGNIVPIYELGLVDGSYFIAMEYIDGPSLYELLSSLRKQEQPLAIATALYIAAEILKGLDYAHRKGDGLVHRDVSPRNVMLSREGEVKLVDFGIALSNTDNSALAGKVAGSLPYMSPEQIQGKALDARSDLYSVGILLWEMLEGERLYKQAGQKELLQEIARESLPKLSRSLPTKVRALLNRSLSKTPKKRFESAASFLEGVNRALYECKESVTARSLSSLIAKACPPERVGTPPKRRRRSAREEATHSPKTKPLAPGPGKSFATSIELTKALRPQRDDSDLESSREGTDDGAHHGSGESSQLATRSPRPLVWLLPALLLLAIAVGALGMRAKDKSSSTSRVSVAIPQKLRDIDTAAPELTTTRPSSSPEPSPGTEDLPATKAPFEKNPARTNTAPQKKEVNDPNDGLSASRELQRQRADGSSTREESKAMAVDSSPTQRKKAQEERASAGAQIQVGASPWADVYLGPTHLGRAPGRFSIPSGPQRIELRYQSQVREVRVEALPGQTYHLGFFEFEAQ